MSHDDTESDSARLFDDGGADEGDCEDRFYIGMMIALGHMTDAGGNAREPARSEGQGATPTIVPDQPGAQRPPVPRVSPGGRTGEGNAIGASVDEMSVTSSRHQNSAQQRQVSGRRASPGTPGLPPLASRPVTPELSTVLPQPFVIPPPSATDPKNPENRWFKRNSIEKRKREPMLVTTYYVIAYVPKARSETILIQKRMCRKCKEVVQNKSQSLLLHTLNCRFTDVVGKKNALDQSRNRAIPKLGLDSRFGPQRDLIDKAKEADRSREARDAVLTKRPLSQSSLEREAKRLKGPESSSRKTSSKECDTRDCERLDMAIMKAIMWHNLPLSICDRQNSYDTPFVEMPDDFKRNYPNCCKPNSEKFRNKYLPMYSDELRTKVQSNIDWALSNRYARGTIMFDGWEDINGHAVINVMLRVNASFISGTATFFLDSVYTHHKKVDAEKYVEIIKAVMKSFQGPRYSPFTGVTGTVSDSARACVKAKSILARDEAGMVAIQDQAHATDLLMGDLGKLPWMEPVLSKVNTIVQATRNNRKLLSRFRDYIAIFNREIKAKNDERKAALNNATVPKGKKKKNDDRRAEQQARGALVDDVWDSLDSTDLDELDQSLSPVPGEDSFDDAPLIPRTAVTLKKTVATRFASAETMLDGYLRSREVLKRLICDPVSNSGPEFDRLYDPSRASNREKRDKEFVQVVNDDSFYNDVKEVHRILLLIRRYLRVWDAENCQVSEVVPATILMENSLRHLKETTFFTSSRKGEVLQCLEKRCRGRIVGEGGTMQIRILQDVHYTAWILDPNLCPVDVTDYLPAFHRYLMVYLTGAKQGADNVSLQQLAKAIEKKYKQVRNYWDTIRRGPKNLEMLDSYAGYAARYWEECTPARSVSGDEEDPVAIDLEYFATNTLSLCPSSCATERSFSHQGRIHTKQRNRLLPDVVRRLLFCKWNARVLRNLERVNTEYDPKKDGAKIKLGTLFPYEDFFNKPAFASIFTDNETRDTLTAIEGKERRVQNEIKESRYQLYRKSTVYTFAPSRGDSFIARPVPALNLSCSAQASMHDRSTTVGDYPVTPGSPTVREGRRHFRANTREELSQLLSASKETNAKRRRNLQDVMPTADVDFEQDPLLHPTEEGIQASVGKENDLRDEDEITISASTARQLLGARTSHPRSESGFEDQRTVSAGFPSAQLSRAYLQEPTFVPPSTARPTQAPPYPQPAAPYLPVSRIFQITRLPIRQRHQWTCLSVCRICHRQVERCKQEVLQCNTDCMTLASQQYLLVPRQHPVWPW